MLWINIYTFLRSLDPRCQNIKEIVLLGHAKDIEQTKKKTKRHAYFDRCSKMHYHPIHLLELWFLLFFHTELSVMYPCNKPEGDTTASVSPSLCSGDTGAVSGDFSECHPKTRDVTNRAPVEGVWYPNIPISINRYPFIKSLSRYPNFNKLKIPISLF